MSHHADSFTQILTQIGIFTQDLLFYCCSILFSTPQIVVFDAVHTVAAGCEERNTFYVLVTTKPHVFKCCLAVFC